MWDNKPAKIKYQVLIQPYEYGGVKLIDLDSKVRSLKINWIKRIIVEQGVWADFLKIILNTDDLVNFFQYPTKTKTNYKFYDQLLESWQYLRDFNITNKNMILNQSVWNNPYLLYDQMLPPPGFCV